MEWTREYHGVSHLKIDRPYQITMEKLGNSGKYHVYLLNLNRDVNETVFTPINEYTGSKEECITKGEYWAKTINLWV